MTHHQEFTRCPSCRATVRVTCKTDWGLLIARHLAQGEFCPQGESVVAPPSEGDAHEH